MQSWSPPRPPRLGSSTPILVRPSGPAGSIATSLLSCVLLFGLSPCPTARSFFFSSRLGGGALASTGVVSTPVAMPPFTSCSKRLLDAFFASQDPFILPCCLLTLRSGESTSRRTRASVSMISNTLSNVGNLNAAASSECSPTT